MYLLKATNSILWKYKEFLLFPDTPVTETNNPELEIILQLIKGNQKLATYYNFASFIELLKKKGKDLCSGDSQPARLFFKIMVV